MSRESFLFERHSLWLWISIVTTGLCLVFYFAVVPVGGRNGSSGYGLATGTLAAAAMIFLMLYAKRKRSYYSTLGTLKFWLSAHIWIGSTLIILVPLHSGFQFGCNVHTLCYVFIVLTVLTGIWGTYLCVSLPHELKARREGLSVKTILSEIQRVSQASAGLGKGKTAAFLKLFNETDFAPECSVWRILFLPSIYHPTLNERLLGEKLQKLSEKEQADALALIENLSQKISLTNKLYREVKLLSLLKIWIYIHLPFAVGGFTLLIIHIFSVFYHW